MEVFKRKKERKKGCEGFFNFFFNLFFRLMRPPNANSEIVECQKLKQEKMKGKSKKKIKTKKL